MAWMCISRPDRWFLKFRGRKSWWLMWHGGLLFFYPNLAWPFSIFMQNFIVRCLICWSFSSISHWMRVSKISVNYNTEWFWVMASKGKKYFTHHFLAISFATLDICSRWDLKLTLILSRERSHRIHLACSLNSISEEAKLYGSGGTCDHLSGDALHLPYTGGTAARCSGIKA